jgi:hypothetical protein
MPFLQLRQALEAQTVAALEVHATAHEASAFTVGCAVGQEQEHHRQLTQPATDDAGLRTSVKTAHACTVVLTAECCG